MSYIPYANFLSNLNSLSPDNSPVMTQQELEAELGRWESIQFTFDVPPDMAIYDDDNLAKLPQVCDGSESSNDGASPVVFETLSQYLDYGPDKPESPQLQRTPAQILTAASQASSNLANHLTQINTVPFLLTPAVNITPQQLNSRIAPAPGALSVTTPTTNPSLPDILASPATTFLGNKPVLIQPNFISTAQPVTPGATISNRVSSKPGSKRLHDAVDQVSFPTASEDDSQSELMGDNDQDMVAKVAAEEDKRRRNTAASARFRIKKKQREQALERTAREMTQKADTLEARVRELEMEVKWLRGLIVEKDSRLLEVADGKKAWLEEVKDESSDAKKG